MLSIIMIAPWLVAFLVKHSQDLEDKSDSIDPAIAPEKSTIKPDFVSVAARK
jgi:hypothetical protein